MKYWQTLLEEKRMKNNYSQHPRIKQDRGGELKPCVACDQVDNGSPADAFGGGSE